jgi:hypothetical protein
MYRISNIALNRLIVEMNEIKDDKYKYHNNLKGNMNKQLSEFK